MELLCRLDEVAGQPVLHLRGEVDLSTLPVLRDHLTRSISLHSGHALVVDLDGLEVLDDTGVGMLLGAAGSARHLGGDIVLVCSDTRLLARFAQSGLDRAVTVVGSIAAARSLHR